MIPSRSEFLPIRGLRTHVRHWGRVGAPKIFMQHGWMDVSASFQFVVDCLRQDWHVIAFDWRGFGLSERSSADTYWFPDYLADLEAVLDHYAPGEAVNLLGHSMGGNIVSLYAGIRPARIARLVNLEGFGLPATRPEQAPGRYAKWLDELRTRPEMRGYASLDEVAARLQKTNPRLPGERAAFLAGHWSALDADGQWRILGDPAHKMTGPLLYHADEVLACWRRIAAPVLWIEAEETEMWRWMGPKEEARAEIDRRRAHLAEVTARMMPGAGHMLHHDQPELLARMIEAFLDGAEVPG
ncbi:alpha/beta hydrolase [Massilia oculi]|uniref:Alpha/beta hydrolase n=1 Tax=Massilia hydrophila TaxID=3044279 RepID=A0ABS7Y533_9BURK|nr:alpha/beta hydrolase [Massilia oculi]MCA1854790.1 alpha/beta hydrolase [Massilia oculi]